MGDESTDLTRVRRWEDAGGTWRVVARRPEGTVVSLCRCDGGEEADRFATVDPPLLDYLAGRDSSEQQAAERDEEDGFTARGPRPPPAGPPSR